MRVILIPICLIMLFVTTIKAQSKPDTTEVFTNVDKLPQFPAGQDKFKLYIKNSVDKSVRKYKDNGIVVVVSTIEKDGSLTNSKAIKSLTPEADSIAVNIAIKSPNWIPAVKDGKVVRSKFSFIVTFGTRQDGLPVF